MEINAHTKLYGIIGNPIKHSFSPLIHNKLFLDHNFNAVYLAFEVNDVKKAIEGIRELGISGVSVTIPHKISIMNLLDEIDEFAENIGAVNTILNTNGKLKGFNTDAEGALDAIREKTAINGKKVLMLGAGGAARAIGYGIIKERGILTIANRTAEKGRALADELNCDFKPLKDALAERIDILINATSIGMSPNSNDIPTVPEKIKEMVVFDTVYNPLETQLLKAAKKNGCETVSGLSMLIHQAKRQFLIWTGIEPDAQSLKEYILQEINNQ